MKAILVAVLGLTACATTSSGTGTTAQAGSCSPATANGGTIVYSQPDINSSRVASLSNKARVCADSDAIGFGYRHVRLDNGKEGYVADSDLI